MKLIKCIFWIFLSIHLLQSCSVTEDYEFATIEDQVNNAVSVIHGTIKEIVEKNENYEVTAKMTVKQYYKGCGQDEVVVSGFYDTAACGPGVPEKDDEVVVYVCHKNSDDVSSTELTRDWKINSYKVHSGVTFVKKESDIIQKLDEMIKNKPSSNSDCSTLGVCGFVAKMWIGFSAALAFWILLIN